MKGHRDDEDSFFQVIEELTHGFMADLLFFLVFPLCHLSRFMLQKYIISWKRANKWGKIMWQGRYPPQITSLHQAKDKASLSFGM